MRSKPLLLCLCFFGLCLTGTAQFKRGDRMAGASIASGLAGSGTTDYSGPDQVSSSYKNNFFNINLSPLMGVFVSEKLVAGGSLLFSYSKTGLRKSSGGLTFEKEDGHSMDAGLGLFTRYYLKNSGNLLPFLHLYLNGGSGSMRYDGTRYYTESGTTVTETKQGSSSGRFFYNAGINAGVTRMIGKNTGLDIHIGFARSHTKFTLKEDRNKDYQSSSFPDLKFYSEQTQNFNSNGLSFGLGFQIFLSK